MKYVHWNHSRRESLVKGGVHQAADGEVNNFLHFRVILAFLSILS